MPNSGHPSDSHSKRIPIPKRSFSPEKNKDTPQKKPKTATAKTEKPKTEKPSASKEPKTAKTATAKTAAVIPITQPRSNCKIITKLFTNTSGPRGYPILADSKPMTIDEYIKMSFIEEDNIFSGNFDKPLIYQGPNVYRLLVQTGIKPEEDSTPSGKNDVPSYSRLPYVLVFVPNNPDENLDKTNELPDDLKDKLLNKIINEGSLYSKKINSQENITDVDLTHKNNIDKKLKDAIDILTNKQLYTLKAYSNDAYSSDQDIQIIESTDKKRGIFPVVRAVDCDAIVYGEGGSPAYKKKRHIYKTRKGKNGKSKSKGRNGKSKSKSRKQNRRY